MMRYTQFLIFEVCRQCNLGAEHARCPNQHPDRYRYLHTADAVSDEQVIRISVLAYQSYGFRGLVGWHYYNEPLLAKDRMLNLMARITESVPEARFVLWTNSTQFPEDLSILSGFEQIKITAHQNRDLTPILAALPQAQLVRGGLDDRLNALGPDEDWRPCRRMFTEFIVDYFGNVHLCCYDWRGLGSPGNIRQAPFADILRAWQDIRSGLSGDRMTADAPEVCRRCRLRTSVLSGFDPAIAADTMRFLEGRTRPAAELSAEAEILSAM